MIHRIALVTLRAVLHLPPGRLAAVSRPEAPPGARLKQPSFGFSMWSLARLTTFARSLVDGGGSYGR